MAEYLHRGHTVTDIKFHFVWATKYRYPVLGGEIAERARELIRQICEAKEITIIKGVVSRDHVRGAAPSVLGPASVGAGVFLRERRHRYGRDDQGVSGSPQRPRCGSRLPCGGAGVSAPGSAGITSAFSRTPHYRL